jgi:hypothetical protein
LPPAPCGLCAGGGYVEGVGVDRVRCHRVWTNFEVGSSADGSTREYVGCARSLCCRGHYWGVADQTSFKRRGAV